MLSVNCHLLNIIMNLKGSAVTSGFKLEKLMLSINCHLLNIIMNLKGSAVTSGFKLEKLD